MAFFILLFLILAVLAVDFVPQFYVWQSRIHIGRWPDKETWKKHVLKKSLQWLKNTPTIKLTDNKRLIFIDMLRGNYKRNTIQHWQQAALVLGLVQAYRKTSDESIRKQVDDFIASKIDASGNWKDMPKDIDGVILAYAILKADWLDKNKYRPALDAMLALVKSLIGTDGTVQYRRHMKDYRYVDTIGFICPFLTCYGHLFKDPSAIDLACRQIAAFNKSGMFPGTFLPCHTYNTESGMTSGLFGWGRGMGWYAIGLIDAWNDLPVAHPQRPMLDQSVAAFAKTILKAQNKNGGWNWLVTNGNAATDSSATATLAYFLKQAAHLPEIKDDCLAASEKALRYLMKITRRDGAIDRSQGDTKGVGVYSQEFGILPFTQGFALRTLYL